MPTPVIIPPAAKAVTAVSEKLGLGYIFMRSVTWLFGKDIQAKYELKHTLDDLTHTAKDVVKKQEDINESLKLGVANHIELTAVLKMGIAKQDELTGVLKAGFARQEEIQNNLTAKFEETNGILTVLAQQFMSLNAAVLGFQRVTVIVAGAVFLLVVGIGVGLGINEIIYLHHAAAAQLAASHTAAALAVVAGK
jgi:hypothetical protein